MSDANFDVVIVGGGNKALICAMYLTKYGGLKVGIFEDRHELGGGWSSEEPVPGFMACTCSFAHMSHHYHIPVYRDFPEWRDYGARYRHTDVSQGIIYEEDHSCLLFYSAYDDIDPSQERTAKEIARFSQRDADTWLDLWNKNKTIWEPAIEEWLWNPAKPLNEPDAMDKLVANSEAGIDPLWLYQSPLQAYMDIFESEEMQHAFARANQSWGFQSDLAGSGLGAVVFMIYTFPYHDYVVGGTHQLAHASQRVVLENGGKVYTKHPVQKIIIEGGKAKGIKLVDGTEISAKHAVVTSVDPYQLCFDLIGKEHLDIKLLRRIENLQRHWITIGWYTWALRERPVYKAEKFNPDCYRCEWLVLGDKDLDTFVTESAERKTRVWPSKTNIGVGYHGGTEDDLLAPPGVDYDILSEQFILPADAGDDRQWKEWEKRHAEEVIATWQKYAPNMTWDNVIGYNPVTPYYTAKMAKNYGPAGNWAVIDNIPSQMGKTRPTPELAAHRTPIKNLYATGTAWHPYAGGHSIQGYNCYKIMAEDMNLKKPWDGKRF